MNFGDVMDPFIYKKMKIEFSFTIGFRVLTQPRTNSFL